MYFLDNNPYSSKTRCLLELCIYCFNHYEIGERVQKGGCLDLPEYCLRKEGKLIDRSDYYHQFAHNFNENEKNARPSFILFDIYSSTPLLAEEISNIGFDDLIDYLSDEDKEKFKNFLLTSRQILHEQSMKYIRFTNHIVIDVEYIGSDGDYDVNYSVVGYLDNNMKLIEL